MEACFSCTPLSSENSHLNFWQSMSTLNELIGYVVLTDCREIWPEDLRNNDKQKGVREF